MKKNLTLSEFARLGGVARWKGKTSAERVRSLESAWAARSLSAKRKRGASSIAEMLTEKSAPDANGCILWTGYINGNGYGVLSHNGNSHLAHRAAFVVANGEIPHGLSICHVCDVRACINPLHLFSGSAKENNHDRITKGNGAKGVTRLTDEDRKEIIRLAKTEAKRAVARKYDISASTVDYIIARDKTR